MAGLLLQKYTSINLVHMCITTFLWGFDFENRKRKRFVLTRNLNLKLLPWFKSNRNWNVFEVLLCISTCRIPCCKIDTFKYLFSNLLGGYKNGFFPIKMSLQITVINSD